MGDYVTKCNVFLWKPYNKHLISFTAFSVTDFLSGLLYLVVFFFVIYLILSGMCINKTFISSKKMLLTLGAVISIRVSIDFLKYLCGKIETHQGLFLQNILEYTFLSAVFLLILKVICGMQHQIVSLVRLKLFWKEYLSLFFVFLLDFILSCVLQNELNAMQSKYLFSTEESIKLLQTIRANSFFVAEIKSMLLETIFTCIALFIVLKLVRQIPTYSELNPTSWLRFFLQIALVPFGAFVLCSLKMLLFTPDTLASVSQYNNTTSHTANSGFVADRTRLEVTRFKSFKGDSIPVYTSLKISLWYDEKFLISYMSDLRPEPYRQAHLNHEVYLSGTQAFVYFTADGTPVAYRCDSLGNMLESPHLTATLKRMVTTGNWEYFIYSSEYLQKYAGNFILPYIDCYAKEDFSNEYMANPEINPQYIKSFALKLLEQ